MGAVEVPTDGLLSKWGFDDGDLFDDVVTQWEHATGRAGDRHQVLVAAVRRWVLPVLRQRVEEEVVTTIHNPIRAVKVDGVPVGGALWDPDQTEFSLSPRFVRVPLSTVWALTDALGRLEG